MSYQFRILRAFISWAIVIGMIWPAQVYGEEKASSAQSTEKKKAAKKDSFADLILTVDELLALKPEDREKYFYWLQKYLAQLEKVQWGMVEAINSELKKDASAEVERPRLQELYAALIMNFAEAQYNRQNDESMKGLPGLYGAYVSTFQYAKEKNGKPYYLITRPPNSACPSGGSGNMRCNPNLFEIPIGGQSQSAICVSREPIKTITERCVDSFIVKHGGQPGDTLGVAIRGKIESLKNNPKEREAWALWVDQIRAGVRGIEATEIRGVNIKDYCANDNAKFFGRQKVECRSLYRLIAEIDDLAQDPIVRHEIDPPVVEAPGCDTAKYAALGGLACVACGLASVDPEVSSEGISQYLSVVAATNQKCEARGMDALKKRVILTVQAGAYCTDAEYGRSQISNYNNEVASVVNGSKGMTDGEFKAIFGTGNFALPKSMYCDGALSGKYEKLTTVQRQKRVKDNMWSLVKHTKSYLSCNAHVEHRIKNDPRFNFCRGSNISSETDVYPNPDVAARNEALCVAMAKACGMDTSMCKVTGKCANARGGGDNDNDHNPGNDNGNGGDNSVGKGPEGSGDGPTGRGINSVGEPKAED